MAIEGDYDPTSCYASDSEDEGGRLRGGCFSSVRPVQAAPFLLLLDFSLVLSTKNAWEKH